uniref:Uncharacterized protein n=1 Tax=Aegilops tauschii subsp. strangulata TaxID=200361 RepID=A0A453HPQ3_AEGTS
MLSKGQGNTIRTYEQLVRALEKDNRAEEAHKIWEKKIAHDLRSVPWRFCGLMLAIYYRNNMLDRLIKVWTWNVFYSSLTLPILFLQVYWLVISNIILPFLAFSDGLALRCP